MLPSMDFGDCYGPNMSDAPHDPVAADPPSVPPPPTPPPPGPQPAPPAPGPQPGPPGTGPYGAPGVGPLSQDEKTMAMLIHLSGIFTGFVGPLIIWLIKKDESPFVDRHGKTALNFFITLAIAAFVSVILIIVLIGTPPPGSPSS